VVEYVSHIPKIEGSNPATDTCCLYHKNFTMIVSEDHKSSLYYKCIIILALALALALPLLASVVNYDRK
jgi:hypothetical protein